MEKMKVGIIGATGMVGQWFIKLLENHPWFEVTALAASERSAGKTYAESCRWRVSPDMPAAVKNMPVYEITANLPCQIIFSALPGGIAFEAEETFAAAGYYVFSNARDHRMDADVPLLIPEVNPEHVKMIAHQRRVRGWKGFIVTNGNCSAIPLTIALKPLHDEFGVKKVMVVTLQALAGAGYPGLPSWDIIDNALPYISGEEDKVESEPRKMLGIIDSNDQFQFADFPVSAQCNRVATLVGHMESVSVELAKKASLEDVAAALASFSALPQQLKLPSAPNPLIVVREEVDRPQPRYDRDAGNGMAVTVGRIRKCSIFDVKFSVLGNNVVRGAAGASILNAELMLKQGYLEQA
jgi:aspartate-semialdehyde dehydrogenase